ncbi:acyl-CoA dehydrogenase family protein [Sphingomonas aerolata]|uniref:acyl-CoA dehydrogenase family protein n=1 Tax=Sphingomonas aerolata TaxID=185951 RepID=UPI002FDFD344
MKPFVHQLEHDDEYPQKIVDTMKEMGLFGLMIAPEFGGFGVSTLTYARIIEKISTVWMSVAGIINSHMIMAMTVQRCGTDAQKNHYLPKFATGELRGGIGLTEPDAGTDLQAISHHRGAPRRRLCRQRQQDVDHQFGFGQHHPVAGQDRHGRRATPQGHEPADRREG